jgi:hypothetical protein
MGALLYMGNGGVGMGTQLQIDGSVGEHDGGQRSLGTVEAVGPAEIRRTLLFSPPGGRSIAESIPSRCFRIVRVVLMDSALLHL